MSVIHYHFKLSPPSRSVMLLLKYLEIECETKEVNILAGENREEWFLKVNPLHQIPVLDDDGFTVTESRAILGYLANSRVPDSSLYPSDPQKRALVDSRLYFDATTLFSRIVAAQFPIITEGITNIEDKRKNAVKEAFDYLNEFLKENKWVAGDELTIADFAILGTTAACFHMGIHFEDYPEVERWYDQCKGLPGFDENEEGAMTLAEVFNSKVEGDLAFE